MSGFASLERMAHDRATTRNHISRRGVEWTAFLFILPAFVLIAAFHIFPVLYAIYISLHTGAINRFTYVGLDNYIRALEGADFWNALSVTIWYVALTLPATLVLGLVLAYLLYQPIRGRGIYRTIYFLPYVISTVASSIVWAWVFDPQSGVANLILQRIGLAPLRWLIEPSGIGQVMGAQVGVSLPGWAQGPSVALIAVAIFTIWQSLGYVTVIFLAGLTNIPGELYDAAHIDGANALQLFRHITLPLLTPTTFFVVVISVIASFQAFNQIFAMNTAAAQTLGGPLGSTSTLTVFMFDQLYTYANYGYASAIAVLLSILILVLTLVNFRALGARVQY
ncbi:MAG: sugar ABC transporter permease [Chloroflexi bacterium]|nr:sugar ABC transporter permease [Chloroflexota bacterium]